MSLKKWCLWPFVAVVLVSVAWIWSEVVGLAVVVFWFASAGVVLKNRRLMPNAASRQAWGFMAAAMGMAVVGNVIRAVHGVIIGVEFPLPSPADVVVFIAYFTFVGSLSMFIRGRNGGADLGSQISAAVIALAIGYLGWMLVLGDYVVDPSNPLGERLVNTGYFIVQIVLLGVTIRLLFARGVRSTPYHLLAAGSVVLAGADLAGTLAFAAAVDPFPVVIINTLAAGFVAAAVTHPEVHSLVASPQDIEPSEEGHHWWLTTFSILLLMLAAVWPGEMGWEKRVGTVVFIVGITALLAARGLDVVRYHRRVMLLGARLIHASDKMSGHSGQDLDTIFITELKAVIPGADVRITTDSPDCGRSNPTEIGKPDDCYQHDHGVVDLSPLAHGKVRGSNDSGSSNQSEVRARTDQGWLFAIAPASSGDRWVYVTTEKLLGARQRNSVRSLVRSWSGAEIAAATLADRQWAKAALESEKRQRALLDNSGDITVILDASRSISYASRAVSEVLGFSVDDVAGSRIDTMLANDGAIERLDEAWRRCQVSGSARNEIEFVSASGTRRLLEVVLTDHRDSDLIGGVVFNGRDVSETRILQQQIDRDPVTDVLNRRAFLERLAQGDFGVLTVAVDKWALISRGAPTGATDATLQVLADRLRGVLRSSDELARIEAATFAVAVHQLSPNGLDKLAGRIRKALEQSVNVDERTLRLSVSMGYANNCQNPVETFEQSMGALARSASESGGVLVTWQERSDDQTQTDLDLWSQMEEALQSDQFELYYQPIISLRTLQPVSAEALIRWFHPVRGFISPGEFIPVAEQHPALMIRIGEWIINQAAKQCALWLADGTIDPEMSVSINVSAAQVGPRLVEVLGRAVSEHGICPSMITIEITETLLSDSGDHASIFEILRSAGHRLAIDDFGTGTANVARIADLRPDIIKIDRSLVTDIEDSPASRRLLCKTVEMLHSADALVTVEGIETGTQAFLVGEMGCEYAQGFFFARPAPDLPPARSENDIVYGEDVIVSAS